MVISMKPFDFINDASYDKKNLMRNTDNDELAEKAYSPWLTNIGFSLHADTILHANLMNMYHHLDHRPQYEYFINNIRSKKRYGKWPKKVNDEDLDIVCKTYACNVTVGKEYLELLTRDQIDTMKKEQEQGGTKK